MASERMAAIFNKPDYEIINHWIYAIAGDGDMMEGLSHEACSLAGHLGLGNIIVLYDDNHISIEGSTDLAYSDDVPERFDAYHWHVQKVDGHDREAIRCALAAARTETNKPSIIIARTHIGHGAPNKQGTASAHGEPLGADEVKATKELAGWPLEPAFYVPDGVREIFRDHVDEVKPEYDEWHGNFNKYCAEFPDLADLWNRMLNKEVPADLDRQLLSTFDCAKPTATRASSGQVIQELVKMVPALWGGSADLSPSNKTDVKKGGDFSREDPLGKNIHFGVREHAMGSAMNAMAVYGGVIPYGGTFLVFSDYLRPAVRLAAIMKQQVIYVFTHDSIFVGEDGPTHEPIEHFAALRCMPNVVVLRPADTAETIVAWAVALERRDGPTALMLSRQNICSVNGDQTAALQLRRGAYVVKDNPRPDVIVISTGSEVATSLGAAVLLESKGIGVRVVSMPSMEIFDAQCQAYKDSVLTPTMATRVAVEAGTPFGWNKYIGSQGLMIGMNGFRCVRPLPGACREIRFYRRVNRSEGRGVLKVAKHSDN